MRRALAGDRRAWWAAAGGLLALLLVANRDLLLGRAAPTWDAHHGFAPWYAIVADYAREGRLLRWNPWMAGGSPDFADPQLGALSPTTVGLGLVTGGTLPGFWTYWLAIWFAAGLGALFLARHLGAPPWGAFVAAAGFAFSGYMTGHGTHTSFLHAFAGLPWIVWRLDAAMASGGLRRPAEAGALWGLSALAGYPGQVAANAGFAVLWVAGRVLFPEERGAAALRRLRRGVAGLFVCFAVGAVVLAPAYWSLLHESRGVTVRSTALSREAAIGSNALHPEALVTFASPYLNLLKASNPERYWPYTDVTSASVYVGAVVLWLACAALGARPRDGWRWWILGCGVVGILLALGQALPFRGWLYDLFPPARYVRHSSLFDGYLPLACAALAALATRDLAAGSGGRAFRLTASAAAIASVGAAWWFVARAAADGVTLYGGIPLQPAAATLPAALLWLGIVASAFAARRSGAAARGAILSFGLPLLAVADGLVAQHFAQPILYVEEGPFLADWRKARARKLDALRVPWARKPASEFGPGNLGLLTKESVLESWAPLYNPFHTVWMRNPAFVAAATGWDRVYCAERVARVALSHVGYEMLRMRTANLPVPPVVVHSPEMMPGILVPPERGVEAAIAALPAAVRVSPQVLAYEPDALTLRVTCPADGWLWVTERYARSWRATVNGREVPVSGANFMFRAVPVTAGVNVVEFAYRPPGLPGLVILSWGTLALVAAWSALAQRHRPRGDDPGTGRSPGPPSGSESSP